MKYFEKVAELNSEIAGSALWYGAAGIGLVPGAVGLIRRPLTKKELKKQDKKGISNVVLPLAGPYRLGRRIKTQLSSKEEK